MHFSWSNPRGENVIEKHLKSSVHLLLPPWDPSGNQYFLSFSSKAKTVSMHSFLSNKFLERNPKCVYWSVLVQYVHIKKNLQSMFLPRSPLFGFIAVSNGIAHPIFLSGLYNPMYFSAGTLLPPRLLTQKLLLPQPRALQIMRRCVRIITTSWGWSCAKLKFS